MSRKYCLMIDKAIADIDKVMEEYSKLPPMPNKKQ